MDAPIIHADGLTKSFRVFRTPTDFLVEMLSGRRRHEDLVAVDRLSLTIAAGEIVGLIGPNGAGKSTLVKLLTGTLTPSAGHLALNGTVKAVSELGIGFHNDYSGADNILLGGLALGYTRADIENSRGWIATFSELGTALGRPLSTYSAGMKARLGFCVAFCKVPEVLIVDEALSVGDAAFSAKCVTFLQELCRGGRTVIMVSHNMDLVRRICTRAIYVSQGRLVADGLPDAVVSRYEEDVAKRFVAAAAGQAIPDDLRDKSLRDVARSFLPEPVRLKLAGNGIVTRDEVVACPYLLHLGLLRLVSMELLDGANQAATTMECGSAATFRAVIESRVVWPGLVAGIQIYDESGNMVVSVNSRWSLGFNGTNAPTPVNLDAGCIAIEFAVANLCLGAGSYTANLGVAPEATLNDEHKLLYVPGTLAFAVVRTDLSQRTYYEPLGFWKVSPIIDRLVDAGRGSLSAAEF